MKGAKSMTANERQKRGCGGKAKDRRGEEERQKERGKNGNALW